MRIPAREEILLQREMGGLHMSPEFYYPSTSHLTSALLCPSGTSATPLL